MRKQNKNCCITKCILKYIVINIIATGSALSNRPVKFKLDQRPPLSINYDKALSEPEHEASYKKPDTFNNKDNNVHLNNYDVITNNTDVIDDDAKRLVNFGPNILNNDESSEYDNSETVLNKNKENRKEERELASDKTNLTTIYLAGYDDEIFQIKQEIHNKGKGKELLICFYLCNNLYYNDLGCLYTDVSILKDVLWKYTHYFWVDNQFLKSTWSFDDVITTHNFPNRKESIDYNALQTRNIEKEVSEAEEDKKVQDTNSSNLNHFNYKPFDISKYYPKLIYSNENDLNGIDINVLKQKLIGKNITREKDDMNYYSKKGYLEPDAGNSVNTLEREHKQNYSPLNTDDGNNLTYTNLDHSAESNIIFETIKNQEFIPNINQDENNDYKPENLKAETLEVIEDSTQNLSDPINSTSTNKANTLQYENNSISLNNIATNTKYTSITDDGKYNGTSNGLNKIFLDDFMNFTESETNKLDPPSVEIIAEDNALYDKYTDIVPYKPKLNDDSLTAIYNSDRDPQALYNNSQNISIPTNLKEAEVIFRQPEYSVEKYLKQTSDETKLPNEDQTENLFENNAQNKQLNILATNAPYMYNFINKQSNNFKPHIRSCHINHSDSGVSIYPVSDAKNNVALDPLPSTYFKLNRRTENSLTSVVNKKYPPLSGFGNKQHYSPENSTPDLTLSNKWRSPTKFSKAKEEKGNRVPSYQNSDAKNDLIKKVDVKISPQIWRKSRKIMDYNSLPMDYYPETDNGVFAQSDNKIKPLNEHYKCTKPQDSLENFNNNLYLDTQRTNMKDLMKWNYLKYPPYNSIVKKIPQSFSKTNDNENIDYSIYNSGKYDIAEPIISKINMFKSNNKTVSQKEREVLPVDSKIKYRNNYSTILDSSTLANFYPVDPTLAYKPLVTSPYSILKNNIDVPNILPWPSPCNINIAIKPNSLDQILPKTSAIDFVPSPYPKSFPNSNLGMISTDPILRQLRNQQYLNNSQRRKNVSLNSISNANSKKVNLVAELFYSLPLASVYDRSNKKKLNFPDYITYVISSFNFKSVRKTSIILPNKNDLSFPLNVSFPFGFLFPRSYPPRKSVPIVSSLYDYMEIYDLFSQYKFPCTNSLLVKSLEGKIYPCYSIKPIIRYIPNDLKTSLKAPINNTRLVAPIPSSLTTGLSSKDILDRLSSFPTSLNMGVSSKDFPAPISSLPISSPLEVIPKTITLPVSNSYQYLLSSILNKEVGTKSPPIPISSLPVSSSYPIVSTLEIEPKIYRKPIQSLPISSNKDLNSKGFSTPVLSLPISYPLKVDPKSITSPVLSLPFLSTLSKNNILPYSSFHIPSTLEIVSKSFLPSGPSLPIASDIGFQPRYITPILPLPVSPNLGFQPKYLSERIKSLPYLSNSSNIDLKSKGFQSPVSYLPFSLNKDSLKDFSPTNFSRPVTTPELSPKVFPAPIQELPIATSLYLNSKGFPPSISSTSELKPKTLPKPYQVLPVSSNINPSLKSSSIPIISYTIPTTSEVMSKSFLSSLPSLPISSAIELQPKSIPQPLLQSLPISSNNHRLSLKDFSPTKLYWLFPSTLNIMPITLSTTNQSMPILSNNINWKECPSRISPLPISSPLEFKPNTFPAPFESMPNPGLKDYPCTVSPLPIVSNKNLHLKSFPKNISPHLTLPILKSSEIGSISPFILLNASTLQEPYQIEKNEPILAEIRGYSQNATSSPNVFYLQPNSILLQPYLNIYEKPKNISYFTNLRPISTPTSQEVTLMHPASYPIISNNPLYRSFNPIFLSSKVISDAHLKPPKTPDKVINPIPYSLISNNPSSEIISNSFSNPYEQKTVQYYPNFKSMPKPQSAVSNNALPNPFIGNLPSVYPFKAKAKIIFPFNEPKIQPKTYSYVPFQSNQEIEIIPLRNKTVYLDSQSPKSTLNHHTLNPQSGSNLLPNSSGYSKLKSIYLPTRSNLNNLYRFFKSTITTPTVPTPHSYTEEERKYTTCNLKKDLSSTPHDLQPILDTTKYPSDIYTPTFASKLEPIDSESKLASTLQSLLSAPSHYKEKLIKVSPYKSELPIQSSNEEFIPDLSLSNRNTPIKFDTKYPQYPTEINSSIQRNLHRIPDTEVSKSFNKIEYIYPKSTSCVHEKFCNMNNSINRTLHRYINKSSIIIPIGIAKYEPSNLNKFNIKTNNPYIELKAWISKLKFLKPKIVLDEFEFRTLNFVPIVKNNARYSPEMIQDTVKSYVEKYYGKPIVLKGMYGFCQPYNIDVTEKTNTIYIIWPTIYKCTKNR